MTGRPGSEPVGDTEAALYTVVADLSATTVDIAAGLAGGRACPGHLARARRLLGTLTEATGDQQPYSEPPVSLPEIARRLQRDLRANRRPGITDANQLDVQALCVAEEAGELVGAYRRWAGKARRTGTLADLEDEVADVLIVTAVFAERAGISIDAAVARKVTRIYSRGWREEDTPAPPPVPGAAVRAAGEAIHKLTCPDGDCDRRSYRLMASEHPVVTIDQVTDKYGGLLAVGRSYEYVTVGGQAIPIEEARKLPALISQACDDAEGWKATQAERQTAHEAWLANEATGSA
jgi:NTP pyrophosphatase (non-canonical NTP hydrolase)